MTDDAIIKMLATHPLEAHAHIAWEQALAMRSIAESLAKLANPPMVATGELPERRVEPSNDGLRNQPAVIVPGRIVEVRHPHEGMLASDVNRDAGRTS